MWRWWAEVFLPSVWLDDFRARHLCPSNTDRYWFSEEHVLEDQIPDDRC